MKVVFHPSDIIVFLKYLRIIQRPYHETPKSDNAIDGYFKLSVKVKVDHVERPQHMSRLDPHHGGVILLEGNGNPN